MASGSYMSAASPVDITVLLQEWRHGDSDALNRMVPHVYLELQRIATQALRRRSANDTLMPASLVNEAYLRLCRSAPVNWTDRTHFFAVAAQLMRRILVDHARARAAEKRGGGLAVTLHEEMASCSSTALDLVDIDAALTALSDLDAQQARVVEFRFFTGLSVEETAEALDISTATVKRDWAIAKAWIKRRLSV